MKGSRLKYVKWRDLFELFRFFIVLPVALIAKIFIHDFWLVCEDKNEARDNGYWFFKYVREQHPEQKIAYAINKKSGDYEKVKSLGKIIPYGGWRHWFWYLVAKKNISSQKGGKPNAAVCYLMEVKLRLWRNKRYFLQHGVIKDDLEWLHNDVCRFSMFACGAKPEYEYISRVYGYPDGVVKYLGLCRFDGLHGFCKDPSLVLVMPTWREWLSRASAGKGEKKIAESFTDSEYFKSWNDFLSSPRLHDMLERYDKKLIFYPHRNMQKFLGAFSSPSTRITVASAERYDVQALLKEASLLITDYSSVFFDFAYMRKPVIFYQFDEEEYRSKQYKEGYFDYHDNLLGKWAGSREDCLDLLEKNLAAKCPENDDALSFFELYDDRNCRRTYEAIKKDG